MLLKRSHKRASNQKMNIAITGHRNIEHSLNTDLIIRQACERINQLFPAEKIDIFSCLAEGADRLLSLHLLGFDNTTLTVVLPLTESDYINDFKTEKSKEEFYLLKKGQQISSKFLIVNKDHMLINWLTSTC